MQRALKMVDGIEDGKQTAGTRLNRYLSQKSLEPFIYKDKVQDQNQLFVIKVINKLMDMKLLY